MKQASRHNSNSNHRNNRNNKGGRRSSGGGNPGGAHSANRVYDSSGPEGKVRGTAQQIIDKYTSMARDAQTSGEGVLAENFFQHAEHYQRILTTIQAAEAEERERRAAAQQAEQDRRAEQQARQQQTQRSDDNRNGDAGGERTDSADQRHGGHANEANSGAQLEDSLPKADIVQGEDGPALIETPESRRAEQREGDPKPARRVRSKPAARKTDVEQKADHAPVETADAPAADAAEAPVKPKRGRPRKTPAPAAPVEDADGAA